MVFSNKFQPLLDLIKGNHPEVHTVVITGGRYSSKSFFVSMAISDAFVQFDWNCIYARFTNASVEDSIKKEFVAALERMNYIGYVTTLKDRVKSNVGSGEVAFKGIRVGSTNQDANLKSLSGFNCLVIDEAQETESFESYNKVFLSMRRLDKQNIGINILNPIGSSHWIYQTYFKGKVFEDEFNGIIDGVMYIHTTYLDVPKNAIPINTLRLYEKYKKELPDYFKYVILGHWNKDDSQKALNDSKLKTIENNPKDDFVVRVAAVDVADKGNDFLSMVVADVYGGDNPFVNIIDVIYTKDGMDYTLKRCAEKIDVLGINLVQVESNNMGREFALNLHSMVNADKTTISTITNVTNKHTRIMMQTYFIESFFRFLPNKERNIEYQEFYKEILTYDKDENWNRKNLKNDDGMDSLAELSKFIKTNFAYLFP